MKRREVLKGMLLLPLAAGLPAVIEVDELAGMAGRIVNAKVVTTLTVQADNLFANVGDVLWVNFNDQKIVYKILKIDRWEKGGIMDMELLEEVNDSYC